MKVIGTYQCDKGSVVMNGICISNGVGDGDYDILYAEEHEQMFGFNEVSKDLWIDLRDTDVEIWTYDCDRNCDKIKITKNTFNAKPAQMKQ